MNDPQPFKIDGWTVFKTLLYSAKGWPVWTAFAIGTIFIGTGFFLDVRYAVIGLMICIAIVPGIAALMYFSYTMSQQMVANMIPHTVETTDDGYILRIWHREDPDTENADARAVCPYPEDTDERWVVTSELLLSNAKIVERKTTFEYELLYFKDSPLKILYLPRSCFDLFTKIKNN